jgi:hypothetical protein
MRQHDRVFLAGNPFAEDLAPLLERCSCGRPTPDAAALCPECLDAAEKAEGESHDS